METVVRSLSSKIHPRRVALLSLLGLGAVLVVGFLRFPPPREGTVDASLMSRVYSATLEDLRRQAEASPNDISVHLQLGTLYEMSGSWMEALEAFQTCLRLGREDAVVHHHLGLCLHRLGRLPEAIRHYRIALQKEPQQLSRYLNLAAAYRTANRPQDALAVLNHVPRQGQSVEALENLAAAYVLSGGKKTAATLAQKILRQAPQRAEAHALLGRLALERGDIPTALDHLQKASQALPQNAELHHLLGVALMRASPPQYDRAEKELVRAITLDSRLGQGYHHLGMLYRQMKRWEPAAHAFRTAFNLRYDPVQALRRSAEMYARAGDRTSATLAWGLHYQRTGEAARAVEQFERLSRLGSHRLIAYMRIAQTWLDAGQPDRSLAVLDQALPLATERQARTELYRLMADVHSARGDSAKEMEAVQQAMALQPKLPDVDYHRLGSIYLTKHDYDRAEACFQKATELAPQNSAHHYNLGLTYYYRRRSGDHLARAIRCFERAIALDPENHNFPYMLGAAYMEAGDNEKAVIALRRVINLAPGEGKAYWNLAKVYRRMNRKAEAGEMMGFFRRYQKYTLQGALLSTRARARKKDVAAHLAQAEFYFNSGVLREAMQEYETVIRLKPDHLLARQRLAQIYEQSSRPGDAAEQRRILIRLTSQMGPQTRGSR